MAPLVWSSPEREGFVESVQAMRRRVTDNIPAHEAAGRSSWGAADCGTSSSRSSCCSWSTAGSDESLRVRDTTSAIARA